MKSFFFFIFIVGLSPQSMAFINTSSSPVTNVGTMSSTISTSTISTSVQGSQVSGGQNINEEVLDSDEEIKKWKILKELYKNATSVEERKQLHQQMRTLLAIMTPEQRQSLKQVLQERVKEHWEKMTPKEAQNKKKGKEGPRALDEDSEVDIDAFIGLMP